MQLTATAKDYAGRWQDVSSNGLTWTSSDTSVARVSNTGMVTAVAMGATTITGSLGYTSATSLITVTAPALSSTDLSPASAALPLGSKQQYALTAHYADGTSANVSAGAQWTVAPATTATITATGELQTLAQGAFVVTAIFKDVTTTISGNVVAPVGSAISASPASVSLAKGLSQQLQANLTMTDGTTTDVTSTIQWTSSNSATATVDAHGKVKAAGLGSAVINGALPGSNFALSVPVTVTAATVASVKVTPNPAVITGGATLQFHATATMSDSTQQDKTSTYTWSSSNSTVLSVDANGLATAHTVNSKTSATLTATSGSSSDAVTVTLNPPAPVLTAITLLPTSARFAVGTSEEFSVRGTYSDGSYADISASANWQSSNTAVAMPNANGMVSVMSQGNAQITATVGNFTTSTMVIGSPATLQSVALSPSSASFAKGTRQQFLLIGTFSDGSKQDLSQQAQWTSSDPAAMSVDSNGLAAAIAAGSVQLSASFNGQTATTSSLDLTPATLVSLALTPNTLAIARHTAQKLSLIATFSDGTTEDVSISGNWTSSDPTVLTVDATGDTFGIFEGTASINATFGGMTASTPQASVTAATLVSLAVSPMDAQFPLGTTQHFTVTGTFSDGTTQDLTHQAVWASTDPNVMTIDEDGVAKSGTQGSAAISASLNSVTATTNTVQITPAALVSVKLTPMQANLAKGTTVQFTAAGTFTDGSTRNISNDATWTSSDNSAVSIDSNGLARGLALGQATVSVSYMGQTITSQAVQVTPATIVSVAVTPQTADIARGTTQQFTAIATYSDGTTQDISSLVTWSTSDASVVSIDSNGLAHGVGLGNVVLSLTYNTQTASTGAITGSSAVVNSVSLNPSSASLTAGMTQQLTATAVYSDGTSQNVSASANWNTSNSAVATIDAQGMLTAVAAGDATIDVAFAGRQSSMQLHVDAASSTPSQPTLVDVALDPSDPQVTRGATVQVRMLAVFSNRTYRDVSADTTWQSSATSVATVDTHGLVTGVNAGNAQIWATYGGMPRAVTVAVNPATLTALTVTPASSSVAKGTSQQFKAVGTYSDGSSLDVTGSVAWSSTNSGVATVSTNGLAAGVATGNTQIVAASAGVSGSAALTVTSASPVSISILPGVISLPLGGYINLDASAGMTDGSSQNVSASVVYSVSDESIVTVDSTGKLHAVGVGQTSVTANLGSVSVSFNVTVNSAVLQGITVTPANLNLPAGTQKQLTAMGAYSDGSTRDITGSVNWTQSDANVGLVSTTGLLSTAAPGTLTVTASASNVSGNITVNVAQAAVTSIAVSPASANLASGQTLQMQATATYSDGTQQDVTGSAHWGVDDANLAAISNTTGTNGVLTAKAVGSVQASASIGSISGSARINVGAATLVSITIDAAPTSLASGQSATLVVTGHYSDGSTATLNTSAAITSSNNGVVSVEANGVLHALAAGFTSINVALNGVSTQLNLTVGNAVVTGINITPANPSVALGLPLQLSATASYSDGTTADVTSQVSWTTSDATVATVSASGTVNTLRAGSVTVTGKLQGVSRQVTLQVAAATLQSINVTAAQNSFAKGLSLQLKATGNYSDGSTRDLTSLVTWSSLNPATGVVSASGLATGVSTGTFTAKAAFNGVSGTMGITVSAAVLQSIAITPGNTIILNLLSNSVQYTATGTFSDGTTQDITSSVHWSLASGLTLGSISSTGKFSPLGLGLGVIQATMGSVAGTTGFTVVSVL